MKASEYKGFCGMLLVLGVKTMEMKRSLGIGIASLSLSIVGLTMGAGVASASLVKPAGCQLPGGAAGIATATANGANVSCTSGHAPGAIFLKY